MSKTLHVGAFFLFAPTVTEITLNLKDINHLCSESTYLIMISRIVVTAHLMFLLSCGGNSQQATPVSSGGQTSEKSAQVVMNVKVDEYAKLLSEKLDHIVLDVRTPQEVADGAIECDTNIDFYDQEFRNRVKALDHQKPVFVYCAVGGRSGQAMDFMKREGFNEVYNLDGGIRAWLAAGRGTESCEEAPQKTHEQ